MDGNILYTVAIGVTGAVLGLAIGLTIADAAMRRRLSKIDMKPQNKPADYADYQQFKAEKEQVSTLDKFGGYPIKQWYEVANYVAVKLESGNNLEEATRMAGTNKSAIFRWRKLNSSYNKRIEAALSNK